MRLTSTTARHCSSVSSSNGTPGAPAPGVVEEQVEPAESFDGVRDQSLDRRLVGDVADDRERLRAGRCHGRDGVVERCGPAAGDDDGESRRTECERAGAADAAATAGDDGHLHGRSGFGVVRGHGGHVSRRTS